ncbi:dihydrodipicolinate synthase family protein [Jiangella mangrovi]|uniref:4-hydroxy-tetrahydrodipicolinate synthase n=1 Tax=Jiangella mangrovi TaxID=1524084 RepID=A0A7W9GRL5_9ACTN|nr:dihydrodipicolinate synthase family protein [Jiangella mangrovi]MBB5788602.1 4-hydroxy-tetrahydrodipicolinate synthase [Jiangella mangrovi]
MNGREKPWHGVLVATPTFFRDDLSVDFDRYADHVRWLADGGCHGVCVNGSLGEYQVLTAEERAKMVEVAVEAAPEGFTVMAGVGAYGARESRQWAEQAGEAGAEVVLALPPNSYRADERSVVDHYREVAKAGLPVSAYNNPIDTKVDLTPALLAELYNEGLIVGVKEFTGESRRSYEINELAPGLDVLIGTDDSVVEVGLAGAKGWISGFTSVFPRESVRLYEATLAHDLDTALPLYRTLHPLLRWDFHTEFVQAIKLSMDVLDLGGGPIRQPRQPMLPESAAIVRDLTLRIAAEFSTANVA